MTTIDAEKAMKLLGIANYHNMILEERIEEIINKYNHLNKTYQETLQDNEILSKNLAALENK